MKKKEPRAPRRNKQKERIAQLEHELRCAREHADAEERYQKRQSIQRAYAMLSVERIELEARLERISLLSRSIDAEIYDGGSPSVRRRVGF